MDEIQALSTCNICIIAPNLLVCDACAFNVALIWDKLLADVQECPPDQEMSAWEFPWYDDDLGESPTETRTNLLGL